MRIMKALLDLGLNTSGSVVCSLPLCCLGAVAGRWGPASTPHPRILGDPAASFVLTPAPTRGIMFLSVERHGLESGWDAAWVLAPWRASCGFKQVVTVLRAAVPRPRRREAGSQPCLPHAAVVRVECGCGNGLFTRPILPLHAPWPEACLLLIVVFSAPAGVPGPAAQYAVQNKSLYECVLCCLVPHTGLCSLRLG